MRTYLAAVAVFCNEVKGKSMLAFSRDLDVQYKTAFVLAHKLREAMAAATKALRIGGDGRTAEVDGAYFGGHLDTNTGKIVAFQLHLRALKGKTGDDILPVIFSDNYFELAPGETRTIHCTYADRDAEGAQPFFLVSAWNIPAS